MSRLVLFWLLLGVSVFRGDAFAQEKETIRWLGWEQVPNFITQGQFEGQGLGDSFTKVLQRNLPQYNHKLVVSNAQRYNRLIREEDVCVAWAWIVPGSREYRIHSRPVSLAPRTGVQTLKSKQHLFGKPGETLSLATLLANPKIKLGYLDGMAYSKEVHALMKQYRGKENVLFSSRSEVEFSLAMLEGRRVDYFFGFPAQAIYDAELRGIPNKYQFYHIEEIAMYASMHTHCSKSAFGQKVMVEVNKIITDEVLVRHLAVIERWYGENKEYREVFMDHVVNQNPHGLVTNPGQ